MTQPRIDLHTHSTASDGCLAPAELVAAAAKAGVGTLALTDHDTVAGIREAADAAARYGIRLVPGVEISVSWARRTLHIVGLGLDPDSRVLATGLARLQQQRRARAQAMATKLEKLGVTDALARAREFAGGGQLTRTHFARVLIAAGHCRNMQQCFKRYLKPGKPAYTAAEWAQLTEAVTWIREAGGLTVLAHPLAYGMSGAWRERALTDFCEAGGQALEVCCGNSTPAGVDLSARAARRFGLLGSVGSDFHSPAQHWLGLGRLRPLPATVTPVWRHAGFH